jgi:RNA recognition motif-containing protein
MADSSIVINKVEEKKVSSKGNEGKIKIIQEFVERVTLVTRDMNQYKITSNIKKIKEKKKVKKEVAERINIPKFGICAGQPRGALEAGVIMISREEVRIINRQTDVEQDLKDKLLGSINKTKDNFLKEILEKRKKDEEDKINKLFNTTQKAIPKRTYKRENSIKVSGFNPKFREDDLREVFEKAGRIKKIYIPRDFNTGEYKNFAFIDFEQSLGMKTAIEDFNDKAVAGCVLNVVAAEDK